MSNFSKKNIDDWKQLAKEELGKDFNDKGLSWKSPEGIQIKSLYTFSQCCLAISSQSNFSI